MLIQRTILQIIEKKPPVKAVVKSVSAEEYYYNIGEVSGASRNTWHTIRYCSFPAKQPLKPPPHMGLTSFCDVNNIGIVHNQPLPGNIKKIPPIMHYSDSIKKHSTEIITGLHYNSGER